MSEVKQSAGESRTVKIYEKHVFVCTSGSTCPHQGSVELHKLLKATVNQRGLKGKVRVNNSGCLDQCGNGPMIVIYPEEVWYSHVSAADVDEIVEEHMVNDRPVNRLLYDGCGKNLQRMAEIQKAACVEKKE